MRCALLQVNTSDAETPAERRARVLAEAREVEACDLIVLPELWAEGAFAPDAWAANAEPLDGPTATAWADLARARGCVVHAGSFIERAGEELFNTSIVFGPTGGRLATYRKLHLFRTSDGQGEVEKLGAGNEVVTFTTPLAGRDVRVGLATCFDLRYPELFRKLRHDGADLVILVASWPGERIGAWELLARARAAENQTAMIAVNASGTHEGTTMGGRSMTIDPLGDPTVILGPSAETHVTDVDLDQQAALREALPVLEAARLTISLPA